MQAKRKVHPSSIEEKSQRSPSMTHEGKLTKQDEELRNLKETLNG